MKQIIYSIGSVIKIRDGVSGEITGMITNIIDNVLILCVESGEYITIKFI